MKFAIMDSGPLISLTLNGLLSTIRRLKENYPNVHFVITPSVKRETVEKGLTIKKYELEAVKIQDLIDKKILTLSSEFVKPNVLAKETSRIMSIANKSIRADKKFLEIVQEGEASCLAFANLCNCESVIVIDERATRLLSESPENLQKIMERKIHYPVTVNNSNLKEFKKFKFIRSTELAFVAFKKNLYEYKADRILLDAIMYSLKYSGTSISSKEIEEMKSMI